MQGRGIDRLWLPLSGKHGPIYLHFEPATVRGTKRRSHPGWIVLIIFLIWSSLRDYRSVHSMTDSITIESCLEQSLAVMVVPAFDSVARVFWSALWKHYRAKRRSFQ
jgi:hypothetical protein